MNRIKYSHWTHWFDDTKVTGEKVVRNDMAREILIKFMPVDLIELYIDYDPTPAYEELTDDPKIAGTVEERKVAYNEELFFLPQKLIDLLVEYDNITDDFLSIFATTHNFFRIWRGDAGLSYST